MPPKVLGQGLGSGYLDGSIDDVETYENATSPLPDGPKRADAQFANDALDAIKQIEQGLGEAPWGDQPTVSARLDAIEARSAGPLSGGQLIGLSRWAAGGDTAFYLLDVAEYVFLVSDNGAIVDPMLYSLSDGRDQIIFDGAPVGGHIITAQYVVAQV